MDSSQPSNVDAKGASARGFSELGKTGWLAPEGEDPEPASLILLSFVTAAK
jgi:hypothetical protein